MEWLESFGKPRLVLGDEKQVRMISHQAIRDDRNPGLRRVMNKLFKEETAVVSVEEDIYSVVTALGYVMEKFGHYDPGSSWHAAIIDGLDGKLLGTAGAVSKKG
jgi:23S rRNA maturation-related 3'-5' exoribonuclease YhaM